MRNVAVIGGGAAGMIAASKAAANGNTVTIFEKNHKLGKKLYITGKGRCNLTNASDVSDLIKNTVSNSNFMYSSYYSFDPFALIDHFESLGCKTKIERGNRVFPVSERASDVIKALEKDLVRNNVIIKLNTEIKNLIIQDNSVKGIKTDTEELLFDKVIVCTGGLSYPLTGSTGDGFKFAKESGHTVTKLFPSLVPLKTFEDWVPSLQGLSLKNISLSVKINDKIIFKEFGEMLFTHFGVSGPLILSASRHITKELSRSKPKLYIDLKPALSEKELDTRILKDFEKFKNKSFSNSLDELLPQKLIPVIIELSNIEPQKKVNEITKEERKKLTTTLKNLEVTAIDTTGYNEAVITCGGISVKEIDPSTMESKIINGLYFAGEVLDVDAYTGGFNLQIAFSTGFLAGINV